MISKMRDINEVIRRKEAELQQLQRDIEALRVAARVLAEEDVVGGHTSRPGAGNAYAPPPPAANESGGASWDAAAKKFP